MAGIEAIQNQNIYKVQGVNFFENNYQRKQDISNTFNSGLFAAQSQGQHNLNYPRIQGSETQARQLDLLA